MAQRNVEIKQSDIAWAVFVNGRVVCVCATRQQAEHIAFGVSADDGESA